MSNRKHTTLCLSVCLSLLASTAYSSGTEIYAGYSGMPDYNLGFISGTHAFNNDLSSEGWVAHGSVGYGEYSYSSRTAGHVNGDLTTGDIMLGYQTFLSALNGGRAALYIGGDYQDHSLNRSDPANPVRGSEAGISTKLTARYNVDSKDFFYTEGGYSSAFNTYDAGGQFGHSFGAFFVAGPEVNFSGNDAYDAQKIGLFMAIPLTSIHIRASGGYAHVDRQFNSGGYGSVSVGYNF